MLRILLLGANGQVGWELARTLAPIGSVTPIARRGTDGMGGINLELECVGALEPVLDAIRPNLIVNAAAYTAVDRAESEHSQALRLNRDVPGELGRWAERHRAGVIHFSTDYVYDGRKRDAYVETDPTNPVNAYGVSKLAGEAALLRSGATAVILRIAWVYGLRGNNFLLTMQRLMREREVLSVVDDQFGAPSWSRMIAEATAHVAARFAAGVDAVEAAGVYHMAPTGSASWYDFACAIQDMGNYECRINPIPSTDYPTPATRPANSRLDSSKLREEFGIALPHWRESLRDALIAS